MKKLFFTLITMGSALGASAQNLYGDFETWNSFNVGFPPAQLEAPQGWHGVDSASAPLFSLLVPGKQYKKQIFKTTDKHGGTYAAKIMTRLEDSAQGLVVPGALSNARFIISVGSGGTPNIDYSGGTVVNGRVAKVTAWIKYTSKATDDSAEIYVMAVRAGANGGGFNSDTLIGESDTFYGPISNYTQVNLPIIYDPAYASMEPNKLVVIMASSGQNASAADSSTLYVDDVTMTMTPQGIKVPLLQQQVVKCYPNPSNGMLNLKSTIGGKLLWEGYAANGKLIASKSFTDQTTIDLSKQAAGIYFFHVKDEQDQIIQTGQFSLQH